MFQYILFHSVHKIAQTVTQILVKQVNTVDDTDDTVHNDNNADKNKPTRTRIQQPAGHSQEQNHY